jgi:hypothetical protein
MLADSPSENYDADLEDFERTMATQLGRSPSGSTRLVVHYE